MWTLSVAEITFGSAKPVKDLQATIDESNWNIHIIYIKVVH